MSIIMPLLFFAVVAIVAAALIMYKKSDGKMTFGDALLTVVTAAFGTAIAWVGGLLDKF